jgi:CheY-like chemotaxis protein
MRVLVVEDAASVRQRMVAIFAGAEGVDAVAEAASGEAALEMIEHFRPDFVTLDLMLPGISGLDVLDGLREKDQKPQVVVLTNYPYPAFRKKCMALGAAHFFAKTVDPNQILEILKGGLSSTSEDPEQGKMAS